jgi:hypothetical protein
MGGRMKWVGSKEMDRDFEARGKDISKTILLFMDTVSVHIS